MPNAIGIVAIVGYFTDKKRRLQVLLLVMIEVEGAHMGECLVMQMFGVLD